VILAATNIVKEAVCDVLLLFEMVLLARVVMSFFPLSSASAAQRWYSIVHNLTEPVLGPIRRLIPATGGWDFSVTVVFLLIYLIHSVFLRCPGVL
jgi:YggT family protein